jgi:nucleotide-binding universal stress UspA family protein
MKRARRLLVGLKTMEQAATLTKVACSLGAGSDLLVLVHVVELPDPTPLDADIPDLEAKGRQILDTAAGLALQGGLHVATRLFRARSAGDALLDEITANGIDLAVIGYHHRRTLGELLLGTTASYMARRAPCHLICVVPPHLRRGDTRRRMRKAA